MDRNLRRNGQASVNEMLTVIRQFMSLDSIGHNNIDFADGSYGEFVPDDYFPKELVRKINEKIRSLAMVRRAPNALFSNADDVEEPMRRPIREMLARETKLDLDKFNLHLVYGTTRNAIGYLLGNFTKAGKKVALPVPNWEFWERNGLSAFANSYEYFEALNEVDFVEKFSRLAKTGNVGSLVLSNPMTPLGYEISPNSAKEIDKVALERGVKILVDDVVRGTRENGKRDTLASVLTNPYVAEGFAHRIGSAELGRTFSYVLTPKASDVSISVFPDRHVIGVLGEAFEGALKFASEPALEELRRRNEQFDKGFRRTAPKGVHVHRLYPTSITSLVTLPEDSSSFNIAFAEKVYHNSGIVSAPIESFYPEGYAVPDSLKRSFRISVGQINSRAMKSCASYLGRVLNSEDGMINVQSVI